MLVMLAAWSNGAPGELAVRCGAGCSTIVTSTAAQATTTTAARLRLERTKVFASRLPRRDAALAVSGWFSSSLGTGTAW